MKNIQKAVNEINYIDTLASRNQWINNLHPLVKVFVFIFYIVTVVSFQKYDITGLVGMIVFPLAIFILAEIPFLASLKRLRIILPLVCLIGIFNPFFDTQRLQLGSITVRAGIISMITLIIKGMLTVFASYLLIVTTNIEKICYALRLVHCPKIIVTEILLIYRYITVFMQEVGKVTRAYSMRAPKHKGIHFKAWGSLAGSILLRSVDRAQAIFDSMCMRGYNGNFAYIGTKQKFRTADAIFLVIWTVAFILFRKFPVIIILGNLFGGIFV